MMTLFPAVLVTMQGRALARVRAPRAIPAASDDVPALERLLRRRHRSCPVLAAVMPRRPLDALAAVTPVVLGTLWTIGFMLVAGLSFDLANVWGLPLIIGGAAEYGLNVTLRYRESAAGDGAGFPRSTVIAVALNGLTTIGGFGSLMIARHQGIFGLGLLLSVGAAASLAASLVVVPVLLRLLDTRRGPYRVFAPSRDS